MTVAFVTGVTGQDGHYLVRALLEEGADVHGLVRGEAPDVDERVTLHRGDLRDAARLADIVRDVQPDEVYHLAGQSSVAASWDDPVGTIETTGAPVAALLDAVAALPAARFVLASSSEIFGDAPAPQNEHTPIRPSSPYGAAKALGHHLVGVYRKRGVHASSCILYNHESPRRPEHFVTRKITRAAARISLGLQDTVSLGNLDVARDWGWAPDYVAAMQLALRHPQPDDYVIGTGVTHTVREFVASAFAVAGVDDPESRIVIDPAFVRAVDPDAPRADATHARDALGWRPTVSFEEMVTRMVRSDLEQLGG